MAAMLDLSYVRANLHLVEEKLRSRGIDPAAALGDFAAIDRTRRDAIAQAETLKSQRKRLSDEMQTARTAATSATSSKPAFTKLSAEEKIAFSVHHSEEFRKANEALMEQLRSMKVEGEALEAAAA